MPTSHTLGFPPIGAKRELKRATEGYWSGKVSQADLLRAGAELRAAHWRLQQAAGIDLIPSNDFSFYDRTLDTSALVGAVPERYGWARGSVDLDTYFAMARGSQRAGRDVIAMEMTKWFDTNYHYIVPEFERDQTFGLASTKPFDEFREAKALGIDRQAGAHRPDDLPAARRRSAARGSTGCELLDRAAAGVRRVLHRLAERGRRPGCSSTSRAWCSTGPPRSATLTPEPTATLAERAPKAKILLATYFGALRRQSEHRGRLPVQGLHVDLVARPAAARAVLEPLGPQARVLSLGVSTAATSGAPISSAALAAARARAGEASGQIDLWVAPSCSLLHVPSISTWSRSSTPSSSGWLAFAKQKLDEVARARRAHWSAGATPSRPTLEAQTRKALAARRASNADSQPGGEAARRGGDRAAICGAPRRSPSAARSSAALRPAAVPDHHHRLVPADAPRCATRARQLTDGEDRRRRRTTHSSGSRSGRRVKIQEELGLDVLVHGEFERNDMVEYFGEQLDGFVFTEYGWVQSLRLALRQAADHFRRRLAPRADDGEMERLRPVADQAAGEGHADRSGDDPAMVLRARRPAALGDRASRSRWPSATRCATSKPPAIRIIQIDEPALREGLPLRRADWADYLEWAVDAFRLAAAGVAGRDADPHPHVLLASSTTSSRRSPRMDADVISIENVALGHGAAGRLRRTSSTRTRSGPGVYDIHSPRVPSTTEIVDAVEQACGMCWTAGRSG